MLSPRMSDLLTMLEKDPRDSFLLFAIAKEYESLDLPDQAENFYLKLKRSNPSYIGLYYHLAKLYESMGHTENALEIYDEGVHLASHMHDQHALAELKNAKINLEMIL